MTRELASGALQLAGVAAITYGCWLLAPWLGLIIGGVLVLLVGMALDPPARKPRPVAVVGDEQ
ncbi:hypothetical protein SEA_CRACKLEWINK_10 [Mycobacterium phage Cracklewink]|uniref:Uncharacterized protein n=1 Tax=Mycobacterium phage Bipper TaxID=1805457 RepID=A0A142F2D9_9CAUD|nr:membrane protein [Mycobacterium phage Bipper]AMQ66946.1 hypothetical protein SEA_BIPPER_10 [Mycobacterium phage Bipper]QDF19297.1 hypothetical protein SEA_CRACKLEWINK_10 [Mycobacterium phage Cracklewink]